MKKLLVIALVLLVCAGCAASNQQQGNEGDSMKTINAVDEIITIRSERDTDIYVGVMVPEIEEGQTVPVVFLAHGYNDEMNAGGFFYWEPEEMDGIAQMLFDEGIATVRINFPGTGLSTESFENYTHKNMLSDLNLVYQYALENLPINPEKMGALGYSFGCRILSLFVDEHPEVSTLVLWAPAITDWREDYSPLMRWNEMAEEAAKTGRAKVQDSWFGDIYLSNELFIEMDTVDVITPLFDYQGNLLVIFGDSDTAINSEGLRRVLNGLDSKMMEIHGADHDFGVAIGRFDLVDVIFRATMDNLYRHLK